MTHCSNQQVNGLAKLCHDATADFCLFQQPFVSFGRTQIITPDISSGLRCSFSPHLSPQCQRQWSRKPRRTDQAVMTRQELIKLQRTIGFSQSLLQYLGTFSREQNRPAPDWPQLNGTLAARWDMNNLARSDTGFLDSPRSARSRSRLRPAEAFLNRPAIWLGVGKRNL